MDPHQKKIEITGAGTEKRLTPLLEGVPAKKSVDFCDGEVFFLDRNLLMGASTCLSQFIVILTKSGRPEESHLQSPTGRVEDWRGT